MQATYYLQTVTRNELGPWKRQERIFSLSSSLATISARSRRHPRDDPGPEDLFTFTFAWGFSGEKSGIGGPEICSTCHAPISGPAPTRPPDIGESLGPASDVTCLFQGKGGVSLPSRSCFWGACEVLFVLSGSTSDTSWNEGAVIEPMNDAPHQAQLSSITISRPWAETRDQPSSSGILFHEGPADRRQRPSAGVSAQTNDSSSLCGLGLRPYRHSHSHSHSHSAR